MYNCAFALGVKQHHSEWNKLYTYLHFILKFIQNIAQANVHLQTKEEKNLSKFLRCQKFKDLSFCLF